MTIRIAPNRFDPVVDENGVPSLRFSDVVEDLVNDVNDLLEPVDAFFFDCKRCPDESLGRFGHFTIPIGADRFMNDVDVRRSHASHHTTYVQRSLSSWLK